MPGILAITETKDGQFRKVSFEIVSEAVRCGKALGLPVSAVVIGSGIAEAAQSLGKYGIEKVFSVDDERLANAYFHPYAFAIGHIAEQQQAEHLFFPASVVGKGLSTIVAAHFKTAVISDCIGIAHEGGKILFQRPMYAGKAIASIASVTKPTIASLRPNVFPPEENEVATTVEQVSVEFPENAFAVEITKVEKAKEQKPDLTEAGLIVSGGRGMKGPENFHLIEDLAEKLGGVVGASRAVVDAGWRPHKEQVGQTGKTVSPKLYIACGISGAIQHLAGMRTSKVIVAINKDKEAPIFQVADYGIVGDVFEVLPKMSEKAAELME